ncbi:TPA: hypothetical protein QEM76_006029 [Pseudomonas putida]|uniref:hypothetical protein n=1 Tax=Pseudomonas putida TaxID=303 RepID=UPI00235D5F3D|nr:hypothetical protein [Pseudomonas putida]GLO09845.1 hypothetical protein PPUJ20005_38140 [Pseudomonas putida]HDS0987066.1 hypothetical protein [Pseudomonas putida]HDS1803242.1 hypothetical protein [Pseudomonas putida]HDS1809225.1 hypothetical protein [Pseudomonas putida]
MYRVTVLDHTSIDIEELVEMLNEHHIVVATSVHRELALKLRDDATKALQDWQGDAPLIRCDEVNVKVFQSFGGLAPTFWRDDLISLEYSSIVEIVNRAVHTWVARGSAKHFCYTNRTLSSL